VQVRKVVESLKPATSVVAQVRKVAGGKRALLVDLARAEANVRRAIAARRAAVLLLGVVGHPAAVEEAPAAVEEVPVAAVAAGGEDVGEQEIEKNKG
jgi:hypothetical protein